MKSSSKAQSTGGEPDLLTFERTARAAGFKLVAGVDEAGRGPLAGPVVAAAVILPEGFDPVGVVDSKRLSPRARERLFGGIVANCLAFGISSASARVIDRIGIVPATMLAMRRAVMKLEPRPDFVLVDGTRTPDGLGIPSEAIIRGDGRSRSIAAASILAKVTRDRLMRNLDRWYPAYGFASHKGYGTRSHRLRLEADGPTPHHRLSFSPLRQLKLSLNGDR